MKVKIGDKIYDSESEPIMIIFDDDDKENISNMAPEAKTYCSFPENMSVEEVKVFMGIKKENKITSRLKNM